MAFRTRVLLGFVLVVTIVATVSTLAGYSFISQVVMKEARLRVELDLAAAWSAYDAEKARLQIVLGMASQNDRLRDVLRGGSPPDRLGAELEEFRSQYQIDFLTVVDRAGVVAVRPRPTRSKAGRAWLNSVVEAALAGRTGSGTLVASKELLEEESGGLAERAYIRLIATERAIPTSASFEDRGLVLIAATPILDANRRVLGAIYGGILLNRRSALVDHIRAVAFGDKTYQGRPVGTVTFFLGDVRVATNVLAEGGGRALGTRVSREVREQVLVRGQRFADRAFVVNDWYLSAYDPIRDPTGEVVGIIYVGLLEKKYLEFRTGLIVQYLGITFVALVLAAGAALWLASDFRKPILHLVQATRELSAGNVGVRARIGRASLEVAELGQAFNSMVDVLEARTEELAAASRARETAYRDAAAKNRAYLEMLGFVTHELKSPLASIVFALGALKDRMLGPLNEQQESLVKAAANSADYLHGTIVNYLNLSRIEEGALKLRPAVVALAQEIVLPVVERISELATDRGMRISCEVSKALTAVCDAGLIQSVVQNLLANAIKYGCERGQIRIEILRLEREGVVRFSVWNEGPGFTPEAGANLFQKFSRLSHAETRSGTGLGLFVSHEIVRKHGGRIWAESEPGKWARFSFTIPEQLPAGGPGGLSASAAQPAGSDGAP